MFEDLWAILRTAIEEGMSSGPREQVLSLYLSVVEPFFCLPVRSEELAKIKVRAHAKARIYALRSMGSDLCVQIRKRLSLERLKGTGLLCTQYFEP